MTVSNTTVRVRYNGGAGPFPYTFKIFADTDLQVVLTDANGLDTLQTLNVHYTVSGAGSETGGNVTFITPPPLTSFVTIVRELPLTQGTDYVENDPFPASADETAADRVVMLCQQIKEYVARTLLLKVGNALRNLTLPNPVANYLLGWNAAANGIANFATTSVSVPTIDHLGNYGNSLAAAVLAIGTTPKLLQTNQATTIPDNLIIPVTLDLWATPSGIMTVAAGKTLTINGSLFAGPYQIFAGAGTVVLGSLVYIQYGEWTGGSGINIVTAASIQNQQYAATTAGGTVDVITASITPTPTLVNNLKVSLEVAGANTSTTPTLNLNGLGAKTIVKGSNQALVAGDIPGANARIDLIYDLSLTKWVLMNPALGVSIVIPPSVKDSYALLREQQPNGTDGGTFTTGAWHTRVLNTEVTDVDGIVTLAANQFTLAAGTYRIRAIAPAYASYANKLALYNVSDTTYVDYGGNSFSIGYTDTLAELITQFTIFGAKIFELRHTCGSTYATTGLGRACNFGVIEIYSQVEIWKIN